MTLEKQVVSIELSKKLEELGVKQDGYFKYCGGHTMFDDDEDGKFEECTNTDLLSNSDEYCHTAGLTCEFTISAFTVAELGEIMSTHELTDANEGDSFTLKISSAIDFWCATFGNNDIDITPQIEDTSLADALAKMLIYLLENKLITL